jgi:transposase
MAKKIDRETYYCVKRMLKLGKRTDEITKSAKVGAGTVSYIRRAGSYEEYQAHIQKLKEKRQDKTEQPTQLPFIEPPKATTKDLRQIILNKIDDLVGEIEIYKSVRQGGSKEARAAAMAKIKLEEAQMWLETNI